MGWQKQKKHNKSKRIEDDEEFDATEIKDDKVYYEKFLQDWE